MNPNPETGQTSSDRNPKSPMKGPSPRSKKPLSPAIGSSARNTHEKTPSKLFTARKAIGKSPTTGNVYNLRSGGLPVVGVRGAKFVYLLGDGDNRTGYNEIVEVSPGNNEVVEVSPGLSSNMQVDSVGQCHIQRTPRSLPGRDGAVQIPRVGMVFSSSEEVEECFKRYGQSQGFGVTRAQSAYAADRKTKRATTWRCESWGGPDLKEQREIRKRERGMEVGGSNVPDPVPHKKRKSKKCNCPVMVYAGIKKNGSWEIRKVVLEHKNHNPTPSKARLVKEYRMQHFTRNVKRKLLNDIEVGVPVSKIHSSMARERGGLENMEITDKDMRHVVDEARKSKMSGGDANALVGYFERMQEDNKNFFHAHRLDAEGCLKDVIWIDARSQAAYEDFGDVVCFDCTYLTNEYELAFGNFVGVNHHGQSLLLGCALLSHEDKDTFTWVFKQWLIGMGGKAPTAILTDQAAAMRGPIEEVMPETRHRWCIWHILMKVPKKLGLHERYEELKEELMNTIYDSMTGEEFESKWLEIMQKYTLESNEWLRGLFEERSMWVPAYMKQHFWAGMRTTQRVESINSFFDQFVTRRTRLCEFGERYCAALEKRINQEKDADARGVKWYRKTVTGFPIEKFFHTLYTDAKFREVQKECERLMYCYSREETEIAPNQYVYLIEDRVWITLKGGVDEVLTDRRRMYHVTYNSETKDVSCLCNKFVTDGILCRHAIRVLDQNMVTDIPMKYVLRRWRKDVPRKHTRVKVAYHDPTKSESVRRYDVLMREVEPITSAASLSKRKTEIVLKGLKIMKQELEKVVEEEEAGEENGHNGTEQGVTESDVTLGPELRGLIDMVCTPSSGRSSGGTNIKDPKIPKRKGRLKTTRYKSVGEKGYKKQHVPISGKEVRGADEGEGRTSGRGSGVKNKVTEKAVTKVPRKGKAKVQSGKNVSTVQDDSTDKVPVKLPVKRRKRGSGIEETAAAMYSLSIAQAGEDELLLQNEVAWNDDANIN